MSRVLVTVGTEHNVDWVKTPDGQKFTLGPVSVAKFLATLAKGRVRWALDQFLMSGETMVSVDLDQMWALLKPVRVRLADGSFIPAAERSPQDCSPKGDAMNEFEANLLQAEKALDVLARKSASGAAGVAEARQAFMVAANKIQSPNQSKNQTYYNLGQPDVYTVTDSMPQPEVAPTAKSAGTKLAYDVLQENSTIAGEILASLEETNGKVDSLVTAGRKFNAARAKADLHVVSSKVAGILRDVDLTQTWVRGDLDKLAARASELHGIFFPKGQQGG